MLRRHREASLYWVCTCLNMPPTDMATCHCVEICIAHQSTTRKNAISVFFSRMWCKAPNSWASCLISGTGAWHPGSPTYFAMEVVTRYKYLLIVTRSSVGILPNRLPQSNCHTYVASVDISFLPRSILISVMTQSIYKLRIAPCNTPHTHGLGPSLLSWQP